MGCLTSSILSHCQWDKTLIYSIMNGITWRFTPMTMEQVIFTMLIKPFDFALRSDTKLILSNKGET